MKRRPASPRNFCLLAASLLMVTRGLHGRHRRPSERGPSSDYACPPAFCCLHPPTPVSVRHHAATRRPGDQKRPSSARCSARGVEALNAVSRSGQTRRMRGTYRRPNYRWCSRLTRRLPGARLQQVRRRRVRGPGNALTLGHAVRPSNYYAAEAFRASSVRACALESFTYPLNQSQGAGRDRDGDKGNSTASSSKPIKSGPAIVLVQVNRVRGPVRQGVSFGSAIAIASSDALVRKAASLRIGDKRFHGWGLATRINPGGVRNDRGDPVGRPPLRAHGTPPGVGGLRVADERLTEWTRMHNSPRRSDPTL